MNIERFGTHVYGHGDIAHAPFVRAGHWIFGTGLRANGPDGLMDASVLRSGRPLDVPPKAEREANVIFDRIKEGLAQAGGDISRIARLDQYYTDALSVDPYHVARKQALANQVAPSTSIIVDRLVNLNAEMDVQILAPTTNSGYEIERVKNNLNAPSSSGYAPCLRVGDLIFVAGQLARDETGNIAETAMLPKGQLWNGTRIKRETEYLVEKRLIPALRAAGSGLDLVLKAQVYLSREKDFPAFWQTWSQAFNGRIPPTTVVPVNHPAFGSRDATIEINLISARESARGGIRDIDCNVELIGAGMIPARVFDGILFVAGLMAIDEDGLSRSARTDASAPFFYDTARAQMCDILKKADLIFKSSGSDLSNVVRALQFHANLSELRSSYDEWRHVLGANGLPFSALQVSPGLFVPGARLIVDLWGYAPGNSSRDE